MSNKNGISSFWKNMWDNKHEFTQNIHDCFGLSMLIKAALNKFFIFQPQSSIGLRRYIFEENSLFDNMFEMAVNTIPSFEKEDFLNEQFLVASQACRTGVINQVLKVIPFFSTTSWILKYQGWIVVFINVYVPQARKSRFDYLVINNFKKKITGVYDLKKKKIFMLHIKVTNFQKLNFFKIFN